MSDNKTKQDGRDDSKIDVNDASELDYAARAFGVTPNRIKEAVSVVGPLRKNVKEFLSK